MASWGWRKYSLFLYFNVWFINSSYLLAISRWLNQSGQDTFVLKHGTGGLGVMRISLSHVQYQLDFMHWKYFTSSVWNCLIFIKLNFPHLQLSFLLSGKNDNKLFYNFVLFHTNVLLPTYFGGSDKIRSLRGFSYRDPVTKNYLSVC